MESPSPIGAPTTPAMAPRRMRYAVVTLDGGTGLLMMRSFLGGGGFVGASSLLIFIDVMLNE